MATCLRLVLLTIADEVPMPRDQIRLDAAALAHAFDADDLDMSHEAICWRAAAAFQVLQHTRDISVLRVWLHRVTRDLAHVLAEVR